MEWKDHTLKGLSQTVETTGPHDISLGKRKRKNIGLNLHPKERH